VKFRMEERSQVILVVGVIALILGTYFGYPYLSRIFQLPRLAVYAYATNVPVEGMQYKGGYWIISSTIRESQSFKLVLNKGSSEGQSKTTSEVGILITPLAPYSTTNMEPFNLIYYTSIQQGKQYAPAYDINDASWLTTTVYEVSVFKNTIQVGEPRRVDFDYTKKENYNVDINTGEGIATVKNLGMEPQGANVPSGDLVLVYDPDGDTHIFNKDDFRAMIDHWNAFHTYVWFWQTYTWNDVWKDAVNANTLPSDVKLTHVENWQVSTNKDEITLTYRDIVFAGNIAIYIPADLADTVVIKVMAAKPKIVKVDPERLPEIDEGTKSSFSVTVQNVGEKGTISISPVSDRYAFTATTPSFKNMKANEQAIFGFEAFALNTEGNTGILTIKLVASGEGGSDTYLYYTGGIRDVAGYTPPTPTPTSATLIVYVKDAVTFQDIGDIPITVVYGSKTLSALSSSDGSASFDLGSYTGSIQIKASATEAYSEKMDTAEVKLGKNEHTILLGQSWLAQYWWLLLLIGVVAIIVVAVVIWYSRRE